MEDEQIEAVKQWPEPQSIRDIQVFLGFTNFYRRFIQGFSQIAATLILMLKTAESRNGGDEVGDDSRARHDGIDGSEMDDVEVDGGEVGVDEVEKKGQKMSKSKTIGSDFLIPGAKLAFTKLRLAFLKVLILHNFDLERHIRIETDVSGYAISGIPSQLTSDDLDQ